MHSTIHQPPTPRIPKYRKQKPSGQAMSPSMAVITISASTARRLAARCLFDRSPNGWNVDNKLRRPTLVKPFHEVPG